MSKAHQYFILQWSCQLHQQKWMLVSVRVLKEMCATTIDVNQSISE